MGFWYQDRPFVCKGCVGPSAFADVEDNAIDLLHGWYLHRHYQ
jgi:hypothetical protein